MNQKDNNQAEIKKANNYSFPYVHIGEGNKVTVESRHSLNAKRELCNHGHQFMALPDHPKKNDVNRCPYCLAIAHDMVSLEVRNFKNQLAIAKAKKK